MRRQPLESKTVHAGWVKEAAGLPVFRVFGDPDDALRLTVLLADKLAGGTPALREEAEACKDPKASWSTRYAYLQRLLKRVERPARQYVAVIVDIDLLHPTRGWRPALWRDTAFQKQRNDLFEALQDEYARGGWLFLRPNPSEDVSERLPKVPRADAEALICPDLVRSFQWLKGRRVLDGYDVQEILSEQGERALEIYVLMRTYEMLGPSAQITGQRLSALRGPQLLNGCIGGFRFERPGPKSKQRMDAQKVAELLGGQPYVDANAIPALEECGFLQDESHSDGQRQVRMPAKVRSFLRRLMRVSEPELWESINASLAARAVGQGVDSLRRLPAETLLEIHNHAVEGGDFKAAQETAFFYGSDLRSIAFRMSKEGNYRQAANVYRTIVRDFDAHDAYAWEYLGFNLARDVYQRRKGGRAATADERKSIRDAYERATENDPMNPLYQGRLLGFCAELGEGEIEARFDQKMAEYGEMKPGVRQRAAMGYFAKAAFDGLVRGNRRVEREALYQRWHAELAGNRYFEGAKHDE